MTHTAPTAVPDPITLGDALRVAGSPGFDRWKDQIHRTGGCAQPIHLRGWTTLADKHTGAVLHTYSTAAEPGGRLRIACGNRRASRCPSCAYTYASDTFHLIRAGLTGDERKHVPTSVRAHPKVFATLTAPSFGAVHNRPGNRPCRCGTHHPDTPPVLGTPIDPDGYDYASAVLFNNHAGDLWWRFTNRLRREIAARAGLTQTAMREVARVSFGKVAEFQPGARSTSTPSSASTARTAPTPHRRHGQRSSSSRTPSAPPRSTPTPPSPSPQPRDPRPGPCAGAPKWTSARSPRMTVGN